MNFPNDSVAQRETELNRLHRKKQKKGIFGGFKRGNRQLLAQEKRM